MPTVGICSLPVELIGHVIESLESWCLVESVLKNLRLVCRTLYEKTLIYFGDKFCTRILVEADRHHLHKLAGVAQHPVLRESVRHLSFDQYLGPPRPHVTHVQQVLNCCQHADEYSAEKFNRDLSWCLERLPNIESFDIYYWPSIIHEVPNLTAMDSAISVIIKHDIHLRSLRVSHAPELPFEHKTREHFGAFDQLRKITYNSLSLRRSPVAFGELISHAKSLEQLEISFHDPDFQEDFQEELLVSLCQVDLRSYPLRVLELSMVSIPGKIFVSFLQVCPGCMEHVKFSFITLSSGKWKGCLDALKTLGNIKSVEMRAPKEGGSEVSFEKIRKQRPIFEQEIYRGSYFEEKYSRLYGDHWIPRSEFDYISQYIHQADREQFELDYEILWGYAYVGFEPYVGVLEISAHEGDNVNYWLSEAAETYTLV